MLFCDRSPRSRMRRRDRATSGFWISWPSANQANGPRSRSPRVAEERLQRPGRVGRQVREADADRLASAGDRLARSGEHVVPIRELELQSHEPRRALTVRLDQRREPRTGAADVDHPAEVRLAVEEAVDVEIDGHALFVAAI